MNKKFIQNLSKREFEQLKEYIFQLQKANYYRKELSRIRILPLSNNKKESTKLLFDYVYYLLTKGKNAKNNPFKKG